MKKIPKKMHGPRRERGVVLLFCLIILVVLLAGGVAVMRSMNSSLFSAGNLSFRRDLVNQGEQAISQAMRAFQAGGALASSADTAAHKPAANYSAIQLVSNPRGIPEVLLKKNTLTGPDVSGATFVPTGAAITGSGNVTLRYVIDRMCNNTGTFAAIGTGACVSDLSSNPTGGDASHLVEGVVSLPSPPIYRVTVRVDGPRDTQVFLQASFTKPE
jgi:Tfp pilus assembly protein PilX